MLMLKMVHTYLIGIPKKIIEKVTQAVMRLVVEQF